MIQGRRPPVGGRWWMASRHYKCLSTALFLWALAVTTAIHQAEDGDCCRYAPTPCRTACHQVPLWQLSGEERDQHLAHLTASCPAHLEEYWTCVNKTLAGMMEGVGWWGRPCCRLALAPACQAACLRAHHAPQLAPACRPSHEIDLFECVRRTEQGAGCCARTQSYKCRTSCEAVFAARSPSRRLRHQLARDCHAHTYVTSCARFLTRTTPAHRPESKLHCCAASESSSCRATCRAVLTSEAPQQDILDQLEESCGIVDLTVGVWTCLFRHSDAAAPEVRQVSNLVRLGLDAGKLSCCSRAVSLECRGLCGRAFSTEWGRAWDALHTSCLTRPEEAALLSCLGEADTPCQQGCSGLAFCTNFNHRPNDLFRSCNARADEAAEKDLRLWEDSLTLTLPGLAAAVPLKSVSECEPELWRAVACTLHLRPCHVATLTNTICWQDCVRLLSRCMREPGSSSSSTGLGGEGSATPTTAASVCSALSPPPGSPCVSITGFLTPSPLPNEPPWRVPTSPCRPDPCPPRHLCSVNPQCGPGRPCPPYLCTPACTLGEVSSVAVPVGAFVSIPSSSETSRCGRLCECGGAGALERCRYLACVEPAPCWLGTSKFEHATEVVVGCRLCACHAGELTCVPRPNCDLQLLNTLPPSMGMSAGMVSRSLRVGTTGAGEAIEGLPCGCLDHWVPVCAADGRTFPSECLARCAGVKEGLWVEGECGLQDVCGGVKCGRGEKCIPAPATCLTLPTTKCPQHICAPLSGECPGEASIRACDTQRRQHQSLCELVRAGGTLAHLGNCSMGCSLEGPVCGRDGRTWASECEARAHFVPIDYEGVCRAVGAPGGCSCPSVTCPHQPQPKCVGVASVGVCCGRVCGGGLVLAWSTREVEVAAVALPYLRPLTVSALLAALATHVRISECEVSGHMTLEGHLLVHVTPRPDNPHQTPGDPPPPLLSRACVVEAERLVGMVGARSPRLLAALPAHALTLAAPAHTSSASPTSAFHAHINSTATLILCSLILLVIRRFYTSL